VSKAKSAYADAGVDIDVMMGALDRAKRMIRATATPGVASDVGSFGGVFRIPGTRRLFVTSIDGVGTKLKVAHLAGVHDTVGRDLVNHCVNDILTLGADPLFFLDYVGTARLDPQVFEQVVAGLCKACRANGCALLGGETAEMPGLYPEGEYDLVGVIVGTVDRSALITGRRIRGGQVILGLSSSGLHTNGYSLAREVLFKQAGLKVTDRLPGSRTTVGRALLAVHKSYLRPIRALRRKVRVTGLAHITGGGITDNLPRILPPGVGAEIDRSAWRVPRLFRFIRDAGGVDEDEMHRVFNMGLGMLVVVPAGEADRALEVLRAHGEKARRIGRIVGGAAGVRYTG
jgi:phosphoribosylformylglycinamidine cyclo-ligase